MNKEITNIKKLFDDVVTDPNGSQWSQVCFKCADAISINKSLLDDVGSGICGVEGCSNESEYYVDFIGANN